MGPVNPESSHFMELSCTVPASSFPIQPTPKIQMLYSPPPVSLPVIVLPLKCNEKEGVVLPTVIAVFGLQS